MSKLPKLKEQSRHSLRRLVAASVLLLLLSCVRLCAMPRGKHCSPCLPVKQPIEDPTGSALRAFQQALARTQAGEASELEPAITRIVHYGDSHVAADLLTGALRRHWQRDFGNAGAGFVLAASPWHWHTRPGVTSNASAGWRVDGLRQTDRLLDNQLGLAGLSFSVMRAGERLQIITRAERFECYLLQQPNAGAVEFRLDGQPLLPIIELAATETATQFVALAAASGQPHTLELRTVADGAVRVFGFVAERAVAGVSYDALGINGLRAPQLLAWDWQLLGEQLEQRAPDLIVIAYGSNEVGDAELNLAAYRHSFAALLKRFQRAAPQASLLVIAPPDRAEWINGRWRTLPKLPGLVEAQRLAARDTGAAFWDLFRAMGGVGSINRWAAQKPPLAQTDRVHLTAAGYKLVADTLYDELLDGYNKQRATDN